MKTIEIDNLVGGIYPEDLPEGEMVNLSEESPKGRLAKSYFKKLMFEYFQELSSGYCGWGITFIKWLEINGWQKVKGEHKAFKRIKGEE